METKFYSAEELFEHMQYEIPYVSRIEGLRKGSDEVTFHIGSFITATEADIGILKIFHDMECCETVELIDFENDIRDHGQINPKLLGLEIVNNKSEVSDEDHESKTWTFLRLKTSEGEIFMRWLGSSTGYYSELPKITTTSLVCKEFE